MNKVVDTEFVWLGDERTTRFYENGRIVKIKHHVKHYDGSLELVFEEHREYHPNGNIKAIWNSEGDLFDFDENGNFID